MSYGQQKYKQPQHSQVEYQQYSVVERPVEDYCGGGVGGYRTENTAMIMTDYSTPSHHHHGHGEAVYNHRESYKGAGYYGGGRRHSNYLGRIQDNCDEDVVEDVEVIKRKQFVY